MIKEITMQEEPAVKQPRKTGLRIVHDPAPVGRPKIAEAEPEEPYYQDLAEKEIAEMRRATRASSQQ